MKQQWAATKLKDHLISTIHIKIFQVGEKYWPINNEPLEQTTTSIHHKPKESLPYSTLCSIRKKNTFPWNSWLSKWLFHQLNLQIFIECLIWGILGGKDAVGNKTDKNPSHLGTYISEGDRTNKHKIYNVLNGDKWHILKNNNKADQD